MKKENVSAFDNKKKYKRRTDEEIKQEFFEPKDYYGYFDKWAKNKNLRKMKKFDRKYPAYRKSLQIVIHQYCEYPTDTYGWTEAAQEK